RFFRYRAEVRIRVLAWRSLLLYAAQSRQRLTRQWFEAAAKCPLIWFRHFIGLAFEGRNVRLLAASVAAATVAVAISITSTVAISITSTVAISPARAAAKFFGCRRRRP